MAGSMWHKRSIAQLDAPSDGRESVHGILDPKTTRCGDIRKSTALIASSEP